MERNKIITINIPQENENLSNHFKITTREIGEIFSYYTTRTSCEGLDKILEFDGIDGLAQKLRTDCLNGISGTSEDIKERMNYLGSNHIQKNNLPSFWFYVWDEIRDLTLILLFIVAILEIGVGASPLAFDPEKDWVDGLSKVVAALISVIVTSITNFFKEKKFKEFNDYSKNVIKFAVIRNSKKIEIISDEILVGDIILIKRGEILPADGLLIEGHGIKIDESVFDGKSVLKDKEAIIKCLEIKDNYQIHNINKSDKNSMPTPVLLSGTQVHQGSGKYMILAVGRQTAYAQRRNIVLYKNEGKTNLEIKLSKLTGDISKFGLSVAIVLLVGLMIRLGVNYSHNITKYQEYVAQHLNRPNKENISTVPSATLATSIINIFLMSVVILLVALPEGIPLSMTLSLSFSIINMMKGNNLVRRMDACENMGCVNYICTNKTGALTHNKLTVESFFDGKDILEIKSFFRENDYLIDKVFIPPIKIFKTETYFDLLSITLCLNSEMEFAKNEEITNSNKIDLVFSNMLQRLGVNIFDLRNKYFCNDRSKIDVLPFNSSRKKMSSIISSDDFPSGHRIFMKGGAEIILPSLTAILDPFSCEICQMEDKIMFEIKNVIKMFSEKALTSICIAYKDISADELNSYTKMDDQGYYLIEKDDFILVGIAGIRDNIRMEVSDAITISEEAGIKVIMVTGDSKETAVEFSKQAKILSIDNKKYSKDYTVLTGEEFYKEIEGVECAICNEDIKICQCPTNKEQADAMNLNPDKIRKERIKNIEKFNIILKELRVLARSRPQDKYSLVLGLKAQGNIVAVTGNRAEDALSLCKANVGFGMFLDGTDVAKYSADVLLLDDNFTSILTGIMWGRNLLESIRKYIQFQLTVNFSACMLVLIASFIDDEAPLAPVQLLWLNIIINSLGSLSLTSDKPDLSLFKRKPTSKKENIINLKMWKHIIFNALAILSISLFLYLYGPNFIREDNVLRIKESETIYKCYNEFPGRLPLNDTIYYIFHGSGNIWPIDVLLNRTATSSQCGKYINSFNMSIAKRTYHSEFGGTAHMTIIFNFFVFYILFYQINSRKINDEFNIWKGIQKNYLFISIFVLEVIIQVILVQYGSNVFHTVKYGLSGTQWGISLAFALICFPMSIIIKLIPIERMHKCFTKKKAKREIEILYGKEEARKIKATTLSEREFKEEVIDFDENMEIHLPRYYLQDVLRKDPLRVLINKPSFTLKMRQSKSESKASI